MPEGDQGAVKLYDGLHGYLQEAGIDGVKVDGQSILSQVGQGQGGGPAVSRKYISALETSAQKHLQSASEVIACMSLGPSRYMFPSSVFFLRFLAPIKICTVYNSTDRQVDRQTDR